MERDAKVLLETGKGGCFLGECSVQLSPFPVAFGPQLRGPLTSLCGKLYGAGVLLGRKV